MTWAKARIWVIDGAIVVGSVAAAWFGAIDWDTAALSVSTVLASHATPSRGSSVETMGRALVGLVRIRKGGA